MPFKNKLNHPKVPKPSGKRREEKQSVNERAQAVSSEPL